MERYFEKISFEQFSKDICSDIDLYHEYDLPRRASENACGYDFFAISDMVLHPGEIRKIPTGYRAKFLEDEMLLLVVRSSMGFRYNVRMCNQVGVIDSDYYNNSNNEGHLWVALQNEGDQDYMIRKGTAYCQGIFTKFLTCGEIVDCKRTGGFGSTDKN
ncbi:MAG: deoxyuridine 5'-triphosphate nucleotidohydrolase [Erysipelotrichaceae bacterium]|nr:deoxyuridine 5'-triphosphate nucleotidohydrolase [Erysipelotrichaceae bacterium]